jgi:hypothetical protein
MHGGIDRNQIMAAVIISGDGTSWTPWTTFVPGAYEGQC